MLNPKFKKKILKFFKVALSIALLIVVFYQLDFEDLWQQIRKIKPLAFTLSIILFILSQWFSVYRLQIFFNQIKLNMSLITNAKLYLVGMYYNYLIPGGTGGDAYKILHIKKHYSSSLKETTTAIFLDRLLGLVAIFILIAALASSVLNNLLPFNSHWLWATLIFTLPGVYIIQKIFPKFKRQIVLALLYSLLIQLLQVASIILILISLGQTENLSIYVALFLASVILSIVSFAGLGVREFVFYQASVWLKFNENLGVSVALLFNLISLAVSLLGLIYIIKGIKPENENKKSSENRSTAS